jgi:hypothetical protein
MAEAEAEAKKKIEEEKAKNGAWFYLKDILDLAVC